MSNLVRLQTHLRASGFHAVLIPSTDEYLSEFAAPSARRLRWVTGFSGSTGLAIVHQDRAALFLDGRYRSQGEREAAGTGIEVYGASVEEKKQWLAAVCRAGHRLCIDTELHSFPEMQILLRLAKELGVEVISPPTNPVDEIWQMERPRAPNSSVFGYPTEFAGAAAADKIAQVRKWLCDNGIDVLLVADPEDVSWLLNVRTHVCSGADGWHIVPAPTSRLLIDATGKVYWFIEKVRIDQSLIANLRDLAEIVEPLKFTSVLKELSLDRVVSTNLRRTPYRYAEIVARLGTLRDTMYLAQCRWVKHQNEIAGAREGHFLDGKAVIRFLSWLRRALSLRTVTEIEAARKLTELRSESPRYLGISMPLMSASGPNTSIAHYIPSERSNRRLNDHPIYWMDSGAQYFGCSTDNTVCLAVGEPEPRHIRAHTLVVKGHIALARAQFPAGTSSTQLDPFARQFLWAHGMDYQHGTGHGVGNFLNIHEGPYIRGDADHPLVAPLVAGMIVSNEPAYYCAGDFGIRIESHMVTVPSRHEGFLEFQTLSLLPIDPTLVDCSLLTTSEIAWLVSYHDSIVSAYDRCLDKEAEQWLQEIAERYKIMSGTA